MSAPSSLPVTALLEQWRQGDAQAAAKLLPAVYEQLRAIARRQLASDRRGHTFMPTDLVHEVYLTLSDGVPPDSRIG